MVYGNYIAADGKPKKKCENCFTKNSDLTYYFAVRFPKLQLSYFSSLQQYWLFTLVLFGVLIIYVYSVLLMLKQKHYTDLQRDFINNMTHEFKTPLSSILIASKYASSQDEITKNPKLSRYLNIIIEQSNKLNQHIEQILSLAKVESSQIQLQLEKINWLKTIGIPCLSLAWKLSVSLLLVTCWKLSVTLLSSLRPLSLLYEWVSVCGTREFRVSMLCFGSKLEKNSQNWSSKG